MSARRHFDRSSDGSVPEPLVRLAAHPHREGSPTASPSYEERTAHLVRRAGAPEGLSAHELDRVWERLMRGRRPAAPRVLGSWARWSLAVGILTVSGAAVAAATGAWVWPGVAWRQVRESWAAPAPGAASGVPRARSLAATRTNRSLTARPSEPAITPPMALPVTPTPTSPATPPEAERPSRLPADAPRAEPAASRRRAAAGPGSSARVASPSAPAPEFSASAAVAPAPFAPVAARAAASTLPAPLAPLAPRLTDLTLAEEGELLGRALVRLRQAHDPGGAIADLDRYAARFPSGVLHHEAETARVDALLMAGRPTDARRVLSQLALDVDARDRELRLIRAELAAESTPASALQDFRAVWAIHPTGATGERSLWGMAGCHARLGDEPATRAALDLYLQRFPDGPHAAAAAARAARRE